VLTGATTGIDRATALALAERAGHLILHCLERQDRVEGLLGAVRTTMRRSASGRAETTGCSRGNRCCTTA
jgi:NAD(P)-dependent dehydrogenase (short-subunit alcohol dehydrogenase family)